jgi:hypothetical protein
MRLCYKYEKLTLEAGRWGSNPGIVRYDDLTDLMLGIENRRYSFNDYYVLKYGIELAVRDGRNHYLEKNT